jgi:hypothetical protein
MYEIRRVDYNTYDVFTGNQWGSHSRVRQGRSSAYVMHGERLPYGFLKHLHANLASNMPINYNQPHETTLINCHQHLS